MVKWSREKSYSVGADKSWLVTIETRPGKKYCADAYISLGNHGWFKGSPGVYQTGEAHDPC